jgi:NADPH-dependent curcumin reductase CurA
MRDGQFLVRLTHLSVDPTQRIWAHEESYLAPRSPMSASLQARYIVGEMRASGVGTVVK